MDEHRAALELTKLINGFQISQIIHVAASLGIADLLKDGSRSSVEIAADTGTHHRSMYRLMHALASAGVLKEHDDNCFSLTTLGTCLRSDSPHSRVAWAKNIGRPYAWEAWGELLESVSTGEDAFRRKHGKSVWDWRSARPEETAIFDAAMTELSRGASEMIARAVDFSGFGCIVDVGGGHGVFLAEVLARSPRSKGILYDLPHVIAGASAALAQHGVTDRCRALGGDMYNSIPEGGDAYVFKNVLLDDEDEKVRVILRLCRGVIPSIGRLLVIEPLAAQPNQPEVSLLDMTMLVMTGGRRRTSAEYEALFAEAGFRLERTLTTPSPLTALIGVPA
jgi:hypothetical protein